MLAAPYKAQARVPADSRVSIPMPLSYAVRKRTACAVQCGVTRVLRAAPAYQCLFAAGTGLFAAGTAHMG
jgi:hypothetical protein